MIMVRPIMLSVRDYQEQRWRNGVPDTGRRRTTIWIRRFDQRNKWWWWWWWWWWWSQSLRATLCSTSKHRHFTVGVGDI